ncbi:hypothetical protein ACQUW5_12625 [Legionella sp. CNM-1927-20]|uniref:hypothetical protein n=1 Tax=Legionella sp. CNM-1927-20 TaxID=3422221 RepID=UPI00403AE78C
MYSFFRQAGIKLADSSFAKKVGKELVDGRLGDRIIASATAYGMYKAQKLTDDIFTQDLKKPDSEPKLK